MLNQYIALVPDDGHWPCDKQVMALGRHCFTGATDPEPDRYFPTPWKNECDIEEAAKYCEIVYGSLIAKITKTYNERYNVDNKTKHYERVIGY